MSPPAWLATLQDEWARNARLRLGGGIIVAVLAGYGLLLMLDGAEALRRDCEGLVNRLARVQGLVRESYWAERAEQARMQRVGREERLWSAGSPGLAQASVQSWLDRVLGAARVAQTRLQVEPAQEVSEHAGLWAVSAQVDGPFEPAGLTDLLLAIESHTKLTVIDRLEITQRHLPRFTLGLKAYFQAPEA